MPMELLLDKLKQKSWNAGKTAVVTATTTAAIAGAAAGGGVVADQQINKYESVGDFREITIEEQVEQAKVRINKNRPEAILEKWGGEAQMKVKYNKVRASGNRKLFSNELNYKDGNDTVRMQPVEDGYKIDVVWQDMPESNTVTFQLENTESLDFFYQRPLNEEMASSTCTPTNCGSAYRPENVVGSYAVYHKEKKGHVIGQTNYGTGKAYHIYRPKVIDSDGNETWGELSYSSGELTVTVPQRFLEQAVYPVVVDPTFGYTSNGSTIWGFNYSTSTNWVHLAYQSTSPEEGEISSVSGYVNARPDRESAGVDGDMYFLVVDTDIVMASSGTANAIAASTVTGQLDHTVTFPSNYLETLSVNGVNENHILPTDYHLVIGVQNGGFNIAYDSSSGQILSSVEYTGAQNSNNAFKLFLDNGTDRIYSMYVTYTASAPTSTPTVTTQSVDNVATTSADGNGNITDTGGEDATERGFVYDTSPHATPTPAEALLDDESFEVSLGDWVNDASNHDDWQRNSGGTPSSNTGPSSAQDGSQYIYVETSSCCSNTIGDMDIIEYDIGTTSNGYVDFYYHQYGDDQGKLYLEGWDGSDWIEIWSSAGDQGNQWNQITETETEFFQYSKLRFRNVAFGGFNGDIALDNIQVYEKEENSPANSDYPNLENETGTFGTGAFSLSLTGLSANTTYYVRAYAKNSEGYSYGGEVSFTTDSVADTAIPQSIYFF